MSTQSGKDVIYIDIDDEITAIIDKVRGSEEKIVALVLPKRATVFQSMVNMKLLKRTADAAKKHLVLITSEASLLPLAANVGVYVARTLQSRPEIPAVAGSHAHEALDDEEESVNMADESSTLDKNQPVAAHMQKSPVSAVTPTNDGVDADESIELDNTSGAAIVGGPAAAAAAKNGKKAGKGKFSIPNFNKFRLWLTLGGVGLLVLIFMLYMALSVMPRAHIAIKTDSMALDAAIDATLDTTAQEVSVEDGTVPAVVQTVPKTFSQQVDTTGEKDNGTKASGEVTLSLKDCSKDEVTIPAGSGITANGLTFLTQQSATLNSVKIGNQCRNSNFPDFSTKTVPVIAQSNGDKYNLPATTYAVAGVSNVSGQGTAMSGGTSVIVKIVSQADIDSARQKIESQDQAVIRQELSEALRAKSLFIIDETFKAGDPEITPSAKVGDEAPNITVTLKTTYSLFGVKESDLRKLVAEAVKEDLDEKRQNIIDYGLKNAEYKLQNQQAQSALVLIDTTAIAGSNLNLTDIRKQVAGKKSGDAKEIIGKYPGVTSVDVQYSPFWVSSIPKKQAKINITVEKPVISNKNDR